MEEFSYIEYIDAAYFDLDLSEEDVKNFKFKIHQAFGRIVNENNEMVAIEYIKSDNKNFNGKISEGLLLPRNAITKIVRNVIDQNSLIFNISQLHNELNFKIGAEAKILWNDIVHVSNTNRIDLSIMEINGEIIFSNDRYIVIKNGKNIRTYPEPQKPHPVYIPKYYFIPKSFIIKVEN